MCVGNPEHPVTAERSPLRLRLLTLGPVTSDLRVFAQQPEPRVDVVAWNAHATRFLATRIGLSAPPADPADERAWTTFVVAPEGAEPGLVSARGRLRTGEDLALAQAADDRAGPAGLALLARRCDTVWLVARRDDADVLALRLAVILAGVLLGPILDVTRGVLIGAKSARQRLETL